MTSNIFYLDTNPTACASMYYDTHVIKSPFEILQVLAGVQCDHLLLGKGKAEALGFYKPPPHVFNDNLMVEWGSVREGYFYLLTLCAELIREHTHRFGTQHPCTEMYNRIEQNARPPSRSDANYNLPFCMPIQYLPSAASPVRTREEVAQVYREYYRLAFKRERSFTNRQPPTWNLSSDTTMGGALGEPLTHPQAPPDWAMVLDARLGYGTG